MEMPGAPPPILLYTLVARSMTVLAECNPYPGNASRIAMDMLIKMQKKDGRQHLQINGFALSTLVSGGFTYIVVADAKLGQNMTYVYLDIVKQKVEAEIARLGNHVELSKALPPILHATMLDCANRPGQLQQQAVQQKIDVVKDVIRDNMTALVQRGEQLDVLSVKTDKLNDDAQLFQKKATKLKQKMCWRSWKLAMLIGVVLLAVIAIIVISTCFSIVGGNKCKPS